MKKLIPTSGLALTLKGNFAPALKGTLKNLLVIVFIALTAFACQQKPQHPDFLIGEWKRVNDQPGKETFENWDKNLNGFGYTLEKGDTVFMEHMGFFEEDGDLYLEVKGKQNAVRFFISEINDTSFVSINLQHDFPTKIAYWLSGQQLKAHVSNADFGIDYIFERISK